MRQHGANQNPSLNEATSRPTDPKAMPLSSLVAELPSFTDSAMKDSQIDSQSLSCTDYTLSVPVKKIASQNKLKSTNKQGITYRLSTSVTTSQAGEEQYMMLSCNE